MFPYRHVPHAGGSQRTFMDIPDINRYLCCLRSILRLRTNGFEIHQRLFFRIPLRIGSLCYPDAESDSRNGSYPPDAFPRINDSLVLRPYRYDLRTYTHTWRSRACRFDEDYAVPERMLCDCRSCQSWSAGLEWFHCRNDNLRRFIPEQRCIPPYIDYHCLLLDCDYSSLYPASGR